MKTKNGEAFATQTDLKNKIGDVFELVEEYGQVTITSYNKPAYTISLYHDDAETEPVESHHTQDNLESEGENVEPKDISKNDEVNITSESDKDLITSTGAEINTISADHYDTISGDSLDTGGINIQTDVTSQTDTLEEESIQEFTEMASKYAREKTEPVQSDNDDEDQIKSESGANLHIDHASKLPDSESELTNDSHQPQQDLLPEEIPPAVGDGRPGSISSIIGNGIIEEIPAANSKDAEHAVENHSEQQSDQRETEAKQEEVAHKPAPLLAHTTYNEMWDRSGAKEQAWVDNVKNLL